MSEKPQEYEILMVMRRVLSAIIKDTTPPPGMHQPLSQQTIEDIRACLVLIATRERELAEARGVKMERPFFTDERPATEVIPLANIQRQKKDEQQ